MKTVVLCLLFLSSSLVAADLPRQCVTYDFSGGRFGDSLLCYLHAKWISYQTRIPLGYRPFSLSDQLVLHKKERIFIPRLTAVEKRRETLFNIDYIKAHARNEALFIVPYFDEAERRFSSLHVDWNDRGFKQIIRKYVAPTKPVPKLPFPKDRVTIALHVRTGVGFDSPMAWKMDPMKFPPLEYYAAQIEKIYEIFRNAPLHVHLFTDDPDPKKLTTTLEERLIDLPVTYSYREEGNRHNANVIEDFFGLMQCDCLVRSHSSYSLVAGKVHDFKVEISPLHYHINDKTVTIDYVRIKKS